VSDTSGKVHSRSSQLSKSLHEVLHDKDALAYFISYLQSLGADNLIRFWLDVEAFRLAAERTAADEAIWLAADRALPTEPIRLAADKAQSMEPVRLAAEQTSSNEAIRLATSKAAPAKTTRLAAGHIPTAETVQLATDHTLPTTNRKPVETPTSSDDCRGSDRTPEVTQQRLPSNYCGHPSSSASNSPKAIGRLPAHGEGVVSTDAADPSSSAVPSGLFRAPVDCCAASNPSVAVASHSMQQPTTEVYSNKGDVIQTESATISSSSTHTNSVPEPSREG